MVELLRHLRQALGGTLISGVGLRDRRLEDQEVLGELCEEEGHEGLQRIWDVSRFTSTRAARNTHLPGTSSSCSNCARYIEGYLQGG